MACSAMAVMFSDGFTPGLAGTVEPSQTKPDQGRALVGPRSAHLPGPMAPLESRSMTVSRLKDPLRWLGGYSLNDCTN